MRTRRPSVRLAAGSACRMARRAAVAVPGLAEAVRTARLDVLRYSVVRGAGDGDDLVYARRIARIGALLVGALRPAPPDPRRGRPNRRPARRNAAITAAVPIVLAARRRRRR